MMRDRRNTNLSTSSTSSSDLPFTSPPSYPTEKRLVIDQSTEPSARSTNPHRYALYRISTLLCMLIFVAVHSFVLRRHFGDGSLAAYSEDGTRQDIPVISSKAERIDLLDPAGRQQWTISIPANSPWPLPGSEYDELCRPRRVQSITSSPVWRARLQPDGAAYMDMQDARDMNILPAQSTNMTNICPTSLTYVINPNEASFGKALLMLWLTYGIAMTEGRAFFVDDSHWVYGSLNTYFTIPNPGCAQPPKTDIVPCPTTAKHAMISSATAHWSLFPRLMGRSKSWRLSVHPSRQAFDFLRLGYDALFFLTGDDKTYAESKVAQLRQKADAQHHPLVGMHIRRGDSHPFELPFSQDYLPFERYTDAAKTLLQSSTGNNASSSMLLASDDPDLINSNALILAAAPVHLERVQDRIQLATKAALDRDSPAQPIRQPGSAYVKHVDENAGWDGGFYTPLFFSLGKDKSSQHLPRSSSYQAAPSEETLRMRQLIARSYLLDLEILSHADGVVCAVSSAACRLLAVMQGWDAVKDGRWVNVDDGRPWSWDGSR